MRMRIRDITIVELIERNEGLVSLRTLNVLYRTLTIKTLNPNLEDVVTYYDFIDYKTKSMKKTHSEIESLYNYLLKF